MIRMEHVNAYNETKLLALSSPVLKLLAFNFSAYSFNVLKLERRIIINSKSGRYSPIP